MVRRVNELMPGCPARGRCEDPFLCPLSRVVAGSAVRVKRLAAPPEVSHRLREMGFCEDQQIKLLSAEHNLICLVCNARLGISPELAETILVELLPAQPTAA
jgi:Fe2+ transport system protein FeoA